MKSKRHLTQTRTKMLLFDIIKEYRSGSISKSFLYLNHLSHTNAPIKHPMHVPPFHAFPNMKPVPDVAFLRNFSPEYLRLTRFLMLSRIFMIRKGLSTLQ